MQNSRCPHNVQMSSGDERLNGDILDGSEQGKRALGHRASLRKGSV